MKRWVKEYKGEIITLIITLLILSIGAVVTAPYNKESVMTLSKMETLAEEYKAIRDANYSEGCD